MKKSTLLASCLLLFSSSPLLAQTDWRLGGNTVSSSQTIGTNSNYSLIFETNGSDRGRITNTGYWGIGTTAPSAKLHVNSTLSGQHPLRVQTLGTTRFLITSNGNVGIGTTAPSSDYKLHVVSSGSDRGISTSGLVGLNAVSSGEFGDGVRSVTSGGSNYGVNAYSADSYGVYGETGNNVESYAGFFRGDVYASGSFIPSDVKLKQNITDAQNATSILNQLKPKNYEYKTEGGFARMNLPQGPQFGLLSQDVEKILPGLVKKVHLDPAKHSTNNGAVAASQQDSKEGLDFKAVNYTGLIPIMIQAMQEQELKIKALTEKITKLEAGNSTGSTIKLIPGDLIGVSLEQNYPNPAGSNTTIRYSIPADAKAQILVYNSVSGKLVKTLPAPVSGQVDMNASDLEEGTYIYTLVVNGRQTAAKQLVLKK